MTTTIGSVTLDRDMVFSNEYQYNLINASATPTMGGGIVIQEFQRSEKGRLINLTSEESIGLQKKSTVDSLLALASLVSATYLLTITSNSKTFTRSVRFRNEDIPVDFTPHQYREGFHSDDVWYKGTIRLMIV